MCVRTSGRARDRWDVSWVRADRQILLELDEGEADVRDADPVDVRHAAKAEHLKLHEDWIKQYGLLRQPHLGP